MGRDCGYLALVSALVAGAEALIIPEIEYDLDGIGRRLSRELAGARNYAIAVCSEAVEGAALELKELFQERIGIDSRLTILGHMQRGGSPTVYDRRMAVTFVTEAVDGLQDSLAMGNLDSQRDWGFATKLILAARLVGWVAAIVKDTGKTLWVVVDGGYTNF